MAGADDDTHSEARAMERRDDDAETEEGSIDLRNYLREDILEVVSAKVDVHRIHAGMKWLP